MSRKQPRRHLDVPIHLYEAAPAHFKPPKARDPAEIARRRRLPPGTVLFEFQAKGAQIAARAVELAISSDDGLQTADIAAKSAYGCAVYGSARQDGKAGLVMRKRLELPRNDLAEHLDVVSLQTSGVGLLFEAVGLATTLVASKRNNHCATPLLVREFSKVAGDAALLLASSQDSRTLELIRGDSMAVQHYTWQAGLQMVAGAMTFHKHPEALCPPSLAALAHPDSGLNVWIRNNAPDATVQAYEQAYGEVMAA